MDPFTKSLLPAYLLLSGYTVLVLGCGGGCVNCTGISQLCYKCRNGYWLHNNKCNLCRNNCEKCSGTTHCSKCKTNFWGTGTCDKQCPDSCDEGGCDDITGQCYGCQSGFYGTNCLQNCTLCKNGECDNDQCINGCIDGYYDDASNAFQKCRKCSHNCKLCQSEGICSECVKGFYILNYETSIDNAVAICSPCLATCEDCDTASTCTECLSGAYGPICQYHCNDSNCHRCNKVDNVEKCTECVTGYKLNDTICVPEITCSQNCANGCNENLLCVGGCKDEWSGQTCTVKCASQCQKCQQNNKTACTECKQDYFLPFCDNPCSDQCSRQPPEQTCRLQDGFCLNGCTNGYWGDTCNKSCNIGCISKQCSQTNASCAICDRKYYGAACEHICNEHCVINGSESVICEMSDGKCVFGCEDGYDGYRCENELTTQKSGTIGTNTTYSNIVATTTIGDERSTDKPVGSDRQIVAIIGASAGGGTVIIAAVVTIVVCIVVRRNRRKDAGYANVDVDAFQDTKQQSRNDLDNIYAKPNKPVKTESQDYIYAKPIKPKKKEQQETHDNVVIDLDAEKDTTEDKTGNHGESVVTKETDVDEVLLENIDDEPESVIMTEVNIPDSDTYYNMAGLVRSRVQITQLLEYIVKKKTEFETEFEKLPKGLTRTCNEALKPHNRAKNRYNGIYAYDATRVVLQSKNFINANYIEGYSKSQVSYIASLGPTKSTMNDFGTFWEMVWQERTNKIIMLTNLEESKKMKCQQYWPDQGSQDVCGDFVLKCAAEKQYSDFVVRELIIEKMSETRKVTQYHYTAWPDKTVPDTVASLIEFRDKVEQGPSVTGPMIVHCSAGIGRTGTYIALDILIREGKEEESVDIFGCVNALRGQRVNQVQNVEQYVFLHHCVLYALTCDAESLPVSAIPHLMANGKISAQYQAFVGMQLLTSGGHRARLMSKFKNRKEMRKGADIPGDDHRVCLTLTNHGFINAVYVNGYQKKVKFIAAQTSLSHTTEDFVSMLYQERCPCVVCLDGETIKDETIGEYIPPANKVSTFGHFQVECSSSDSKKDFTTRELKISRIGSPQPKELKVRHYQFKGWNNSKSVPEHVEPLLKLIIDVENTRNNQHTEQPIVVHCVSGAERSGLFCVVSILLEKYAAEEELSVLNTVCQVRARRKSAVQNEEQLQFCYDCVTEMLESTDIKTYCNTGNV